MKDVIMNNLSNDGWNVVQKSIPATEVEFDSWLKGYFWSIGDNSGATLTRNLHELRIRDLAVLAGGDLVNKNILDCGCGDGMYGHAFLAAGASTYCGQDLSEEAISRGLEAARRLGVEFNLKVGNAKTLLFENNSFDIVFSGDFFEHIDKATKIEVIKESYRVLKPGGVMVIKTPNLSYLRFVLYLKRIKLLMQLKSPFIYIKHTRNNPDNEHFGLTTNSELFEILDDTFFHSPEILKVPLGRKIPNFMQRFINKFSWGNETIILRARKSIFANFN